MFIRYKIDNGKDLFGLVFRQDRLYHVKNVKMYMYFWLYVDSILFFWAKMTLVTCFNIRSKLPSF